MAKPHAKLKLAPDGLPDPGWVKVRCKNLVYKVAKGKKQLATCNTLLAKVYDGKGELYCWKSNCHHRTVYEVIRGKITTAQPESKDGRAPRGREQSEVKA